MSAARGPEWFVDNLACVPTQRHVDVDNATISYLQWGGERRSSGLVFIHGGAAHAHWWSHVAPAFMADHCVVAIDLSGHGDSDRRSDYQLETWTDEVAAVIEHAAFSGPPVLVGHSMGGFVAVATAGQHPESCGGVIIVDSPIRNIDPEVEAARAGTQFARAKVYDDRETAVARFRVVPEQDHVLDYVVDHVARHSVRPVESGWTWKFDTRIFIPRRRDAEAYLSRIGCRVALLRSEHGLVTPDIGEYMYERLGRVAPVIELPTAGHHPMLDVPLVLITAIRSLLADWDHSIPHDREDR